MSKITFRADDDLIEELEAFDASKSEVMRDALRTYLDSRVREPVVGSSSDEGHARNDPRAETGVGTGAISAPSIDELVRKHVDERLDERLTRREPQDVNVTIALEQADEDGQFRPQHTSVGDRKTVHDGVRKTKREPDANEQHNCGQCGEPVNSSHVHCPNCGEKAANRLFCECGDEVRSDWSFCPSCGRRTPAADVLDSSSR